MAVAQPVILNRGGRRPQSPEAIGVGGRSSPAAGGKAPNRRKQGGLGAEPPALGNHCNFFDKNNVFYAYFGQTSYFKAITYQLKAV